MRKWLGRARGVRRYFSIFAGLALAGSGGSAGAATMPAPGASPALWVVSDQDTIIYLFGTIHTHDGQANWFDRSVRRAFEASDTLVLETIVPAAPPAPGTASAGLTAAKATIGAARSIGMRVELGADQVLSRAAAAAQKPVIGLESFAQQLDMYRSLPSPARPAASAGGAVTVQPDPALAPFLRTMVDSWNRGDPSTIAAVVSEVQRQSPEAYQRLFVARNEAWAGWIKARLEQPGIVFVAVGSGHLVGNDSVQAKLARFGIRSGRIN